MHLLVQLKASCYQEDKFGPLGLLGKVLTEDKYPVRLDIVKFLVENDEHTRFSLTKVGDQHQTCIQLSINNLQCSKNITEYLQRQFDLILNKIPLVQPQINVNEVVEWIRRGANTEVIDEDGNTVLLNAVIANNLALVRILVAAGCDTAHENNKKLTSLQIAQNTKPRNGQLVAILSEQIVNNELKTLIEKKKSLLTFEEVNRLLANGANINASIGNRGSLLHLLIASDGTTEMVCSFVKDFNADISAMNVNGYRPIEMCILVNENSSSLLSAYFKLPKISADTFFSSKLNKSILQFAQEQNRPLAIQIIQDELNLRLWNCVAHANTNEKNNQTVAVEAEQLIRYGAQIDHKHVHKDYDAWTVLHLACKTTMEHFVEYLIKHLKADYTLPNGNGDWPLSIAAEYGHLSIVKFLRKLPNSKLNVANKDKQTPMHLATKNQHLLVVHYLILWGADHEALDLSGKTSLDLARSIVAKTKEDIIKKNKLIHLLQKLICSTDVAISNQKSHSVKANDDIDTCELVPMVSVSEIQMTDAYNEEKLGAENKGVCLKTPSAILLDAAAKGDVNAAKQAIAEGAEIHHKNYNLIPYNVAKLAVKKHSISIKLQPAMSVERNKFYAMAIACQQIAEEISQIALTKLIESIQQSHSGRVKAYHDAGASLTSDLLELACSTTDNVEIVHYLLRQSPDIYQAMFKYTTPDSPYHIAKKKKFDKVAAYLKYQLSIECRKAISENNLAFVKQLLSAGASVDTQDTNNLLEALKHKNAELIQLLCENGAKMPSEWLECDTIVLPSNISEQMDPDIAFRINRYLIDRKLRVAATNGDLSMLIKCQHLGADINSKNCHNLTALLYAVKNGDYFQIVHALVSRGATILHSNDDELPLIELSRTKNYQRITNYLFQELNAQFLAAILDNDIQTAEAFEALGADFNCQDEQQRTPLHYAVQHHGIDLVTWLCDRGSTPTIADINGNYPIMEATEKGMPI
ncbi:unnamed protein product [Rotaria sp. Silwood2]|nr:unnamed protein product [Rotaria sp. Silwood2]CAF4320394.1 unnamed protein product [Rotaria sp. Silwood2]